ncbi:MAG: hypothetical protein JW750_08520, partial [Anaerolineaceae bacterium]|nr:hypothetical protein [Anaerolineaceae bacterium]
MSESMLTTQEMTQSKKNKWSQVFWLALLVLVMISGGYFRAIGMDWDDHEHLHPDERFLTYVVSSIQPVESVGDYFDTATSTLNPNNVGYAFYVYGTFPVLLTRYVAAQFDITGWDMYIVGRYLSAAFDTLTILLAYLIGYRLFKKDSIGVLAAAFYAYAVLPIQLSHYFAVDIQANFFSMMALWFAVIAMTAPMAKVSDAQPDDDRQLGKLPNWLSGGWTQAAPYLLFGASFGIAMACKISVLPIAALIVLAAFVRYFQLPEDRRVVEFEWLARNVVLAGLVSLLFFRIFQPYAFKGPGFFGIGINDHWLSSLRSLSGQAKGLVDFPPALQWARRPLSFGFSNLVQWGLGLPLGILSVVSFLWMGWKMIRGDWKPYLLLWSFTFVYFAWQSTNFNSMMRYFTQIYLPLGLIAAWGIVELWNTGKRRMARVRWERAVAAVIGLSVFSATLIWAFMFSRIYSRPVTRVEASDWMFQNIPGPINVMLDTAEGERMQIMPFPAGSNVTLADPLLYAFEVKSDSLLMGLKIPHIREEVMEADTTRSLQAVIAEEPEGKNLLGFAQMDAIFNRESGDFGNAYDLSFAEPVELQAGKTYYLILHPGDDQTRMWTVGAISLDLLRMADGVSLRQFLPEVVTALTLEHDYQTSFQAKWNGALTAIELPHVVDLASMPGEKTLLVTIFPASGGDEPQTAVITDDFLPGDDPRGENLSIIFDEPVKIIENEFYTIHFQLNGSGAVGIYGTKQANESSWDDVVPLRRQGYDPFGEITGIYRTDLNFEMYWDDNEDKRERFQNILDQTDLVVITSNRQWGTTTRVPERYPLTSVYYRNLVGCPDDKEIIWCYAVAEPGMFEGNLGFDLVKVFQSDPNLGDFRINDQFAEEAFTVYDHPKVLIFQKTDAYDSDHVRQVLGQVDLSQVIRQLPAEVPMRSSSLLLSDNDFYQQQQGGTWSALFDPGDWFNRFPVLSVVVWYAAITLLGWAAYPIVRVVFGGLSDKGYPLARLTGMMLLAWGTWMLGSNGVEVRPATIWGVFFLILSVS